MNNEKVVNVLKCGVVADGITDNTSILQTLVNNNNILYFPAGTYAFKTLKPKPYSIWFGDGEEVTVLKQLKGSNCNFIDSNKCTSFKIRDMALVGDKRNNTKGSGIYLHGDNKNNFNNAISMHNIRVENFNNDGINVTGYNVENKMSNVIINNNGRYGFYNEGNDLIASDLKIQRSGNSNFIDKGSNTCITNVQSIYSNVLQKDTNKNSEKLQYGIIIIGNRGQYNNINCQDSFGHGVLFKDCKDVVFNGNVDAVGINKDETRWWEANNPNNCIGFRISNSEVTINGNVTNWHGNNQGASYYLESTSKLNGNITRNINTTKEPIVNTFNNLEKNYLDLVMFKNATNVFNRMKVNSWGTNSIKHNGAGTLQYSNGRYGKGVALVSVDNISLNCTNYIDKEDFEVSFTFTNLGAHDPSNTRYIYYQKIGNALIQIVKNTQNKFTIFYSRGNESKHYNVDDVLSRNYSYRFFVKVKKNQLKVRIYKYSILIYEVSERLEATISGNDNMLYLGNRDTPQIYWSAQGVIEDLWIGKAIPDNFDYQQIDSRIKINPYTTFKADINNRLN